MNTDQAALVRYRLEQAERTLHQAEILAEYEELIECVSTLA